MEVIREYFVDVTQVGVGPRALQAILITKFVNCESPVRRATDGEVVAVASLLTHGETADYIFTDGRILVVCSHEIGEFCESVLRHILKM